jgi:hypothetical protein
VVKHPRGAERPGEEHAHRVQADRDHEHERRPVVRLAHQQAGRDLERERERRVVRARDDGAPERLVRTVVADGPERRLEEQRQEDPRADPVLIFCYYVAMKK